MIMDIREEQRNQALDDVSETAYALYAAPENGQKLWNIAEFHQLTTGTMYALFAMAIGDVILGLVPQEKLPDLLVERLQITRPEAIRVTADVLDFLAPLSNNQPSTPVSNPVPINQTTSTPTVTAIPQNEILEVEIAQTEANLKHATHPPLRTMADDMRVANTEKKTLPPMPAPTPDQLIPDGPGNSIKNEAASWGADD